MLIVTNIDEALSRTKHVAASVLSLILSSGGNQLWLLCKDGCLENVGMSHRCKTRIVSFLLNVSFRVCVGVE